MLFLLSVCGCSPQKSLAHRLSGANRVIVTNTLEGFGISISDNEVNKIVRAIAAGEKEDPFISASPSFQLEFFKDNEHLETIPASDLVFSVGHKPYRDTTGTLKALYEKLREEHPPKAR